MSRSSAGSVEMKEEIHDLVILSISFRFPIVGAALLCVNFTSERGSSFGAENGKSKRWNSAGSSNKKHFCHSLRELEFLRISFISSAHFALDIRTGVGVGSDECRSRGKSRFILSARLGFFFSFGSVFTPGMKYLAEPVWMT
jgi:hypothetical protein